MKPSFQDIIPPENRSIKKIPIPERQQSVPVAPPRTTPPSRSYNNEQKQEEEAYEDEPAALPGQIKKRKPVRVVVIAVLAVAIIVGVFLWMSDHAQARILIYPQVHTVSVDGQFTASQIGSSTSPLHFQTISITRDGSLTLPTQGEKNVSVKAVGTIVVYNDYSSSPQKLIANTRFESSDGHIFRISSPITVPGMTVQSGKTVPGSISATVTADAAGAGYNVGMADFTIPGFKGTPQYDKFYARSKTAIQGGFTGAENTVDPDQKNATITKIETGLDQDLVQEAQKATPQGFVMPADSYFIQYTSIPDATVGSTSVKLSEEATIQAVVFNEQELAAAIQTQNSVNEDNGDGSDPSMYFVPGSATSLAFNTTAATSTSPWQNPSINFSLTGKASLLPVIDTGSLQNELVGKPRKSLNAIIANYPGIEKVALSMSPFWKQSFPNVPSEILIKVASSTTQ